MKIILKVLKTTVLVLFLSFTLALTVLLLTRNNHGLTQINNRVFVMMTEEISSDNYKTGDLVLVKKLSVEKINVGDEIFTTKINKNREISINVGIVGQVYVDDDAISYENGSMYTDEYIIGKTEKVIGKLGGFLSVVLSQWIFFFIILVPNFLIFVYILASLFSEIRYGKDAKKSKN